MGRPLIGLTLDVMEPGHYSKFPWYALRKNYCSSVIQSGGIPFPLPHSLDIIENYVQMLDGLIVTGGNFDISPHLYGEEDVHNTVKLKEDRTAFEFDLTKKMLAQGKPVLGICGGMQLLNVIYGGTLIQHIPDEIPQALTHEQSNSRAEPSHTVSIKEGTLLHSLCKSSEIPVNSAHHQAPKKVEGGLIISGQAPDTVIEGIEDPTHPFCLGVQWHPEFLITSHDQAIMKGFVDACRL